MADSLWTISQRVLVSEEQMRTRPYDSWDYILTLKQSAIATGTLKDAERQVVMRA